MNKLLKVSALLLLAGYSVNVASATPIGPVYPPPGGVTFTPGAGSAGNAGGKTNTYSGLDTSAYTDLYWGLSSGTAVQAGLDGSLHTLTFISANATQAHFSGYTQWQDADPFGGPSGTGSFTTAALDFVLTVSGATFVSAASLGLDPALGVVANVTGTGFTANLQFEANYGTGFMALNNVEQLGSGRTVSSFSGGFYYTEPAAAGVPDSGSTFGLLGLAGLALAGLRRRLRTT